MMSHKHSLSRPRRPRLAPRGVAWTALAFTGGAIALAAAPERPGQKGLPAQKPLPAVLTKPAPLKAAPAPAAEKAERVRLSGPWQQDYRLKAGETVEVSVHLDKPSALPANGRVAMEWTLAQPVSGADLAATVEKGGPRAVDAHGIYTAPTANWRKVLHALDGDVYSVYRAPVAGTYRLRLVPVTDEKWVGDSKRWRELGGAAELFPLPEKTPWPSGLVAPVSVAVNPIDLGPADTWEKSGALVETEPNDTPEQAVPLRLTPNADVRTYEITGTADDTEYFDNGKVGASGDDWYRVELTGTEPRLVTAQLGIPGQFVAARIRTYKLDDGASPNVPLGGLLPVKAWEGTVNPKRLPYTEGKQVEVAEGKDPNERAHQQEEEYRTEISRILEPGKVYYFRVEANTPAYQLQLRVLRPAPYSDPSMAVRQGMYTQIGQVDAWLSSRPRGATVERRIRDTGNLLGTQCMSCHTQSGVWGPAVPIQHGYRVENPINQWHLINLMYECLRPTNELKDAANNTSLAPLDIGDGPAGTRAAGFNIVNAEKNFAPRKLHGKQQVRTANFVLQTEDPSKINAAGNGSNIGTNIVWLFATEILNRAWKDTGDPKYFRALEAKARKVVAHRPEYTDDVAVRMDYFGRVFPLADYPAQARKAADAEKAAGKTPLGNPEDAAAFVEKVKEQLKKDEDRLRAIQNEDGSWGFTPGKTDDGGKTWKPVDGDWDPAPTALALTGLQALGYGKDDPAVAKGVQALLRMQDPNGRWNRAAITGFVTSAYALRALAPLYPVKWNVPHGSAYAEKPGESLTAAVRRVQTIALSGDPKRVDLLLQAAKHPAVLVRYWAMVGLGATHTDKGVPALVAGLKERNKPVRDAAQWGLRQTLLDDRGWETVFTAYEKGDDYTREGVLQALGMRADAVLPQARVSWDRLGRLFDRAMNDDPHPAVRAWASKAAWQWWIWNPPVRTAVNAAWVRMVERSESNGLVEHNNRYASQALFIANGHKANGSTEHQYKELATLFETLRTRMEGADAALKSRMARRLVSISSTFYKANGFDGGPGQLGYSTPGAGALFGQAVVVYLRETQPTGQIAAMRAGLEGAANIPHRPLQEWLINYTLNAPEELRQVATDSVSDPRSVTLSSATEQVEPLVAQIRAGAADPGRRATLSDPLFKLFETVMWNVSSEEEQQRRFFDLIIPKLDRYVGEREMEAMADAALKTQLKREMDAAWYLADKFGSVLANNPDLHREIVFRDFVPAEFDNPLQRHYWVRSVPWILEHKLPAPDITPSAPQFDTKAEPKPAQPAQPQKVDPAHLTKDRALQLYLDALKPEAPAQTRAAAIRISNNTAVRRNPEVLAALKKVIETEQDGRLKKIAENVVKQGSETFVPDLIAALRGEKKPNNGLTEDGKLNQVFLDDFVYFRDYVTPELARIKRGDQLACQACHGVPARVPSFYFRPTDEFGYLSVKDLLFNYREMQKRVNLADLDRSKILRKPLNVQDGTEDGHQGGRRYLPTDEGYLLLKKWVHNQPEVLKATGAATSSAAAPARTGTPSAAPPTPAASE